MSCFPEFEKTNGPAAKCIKVPDNIIESYQGKLPPLLLTHWKEQGWCAYAKGLIWVVNPEDFAYVPKDWLDEKSQSALVFARTAFGDMFAWVHDRVYFISVHHGWTKSHTSEIDILFESSFCRKEFLNDGLLMRLLKPAISKWGELESDECYAFVPALALGGTESAKNLRKVKMREHLAILAQLHEGQT